MSNGTMMPLESLEDIRNFLHVHRTEMYERLHQQEGINKRLEEDVENLEVRQRKSENRGAYMNGVSMVIGGVITIAVALVAVFWKGS